MKTFITWNDYENHIFFSSAEQKLKNFKTKVIEINDYLGELSGSIAHSGSHSGSNVTTRRRELFDKIHEIFQTEKVSKL